MKLNLKERKGITLIALVITIIVLLILAGVSIAMLTGENGILNQAQEAKKQTAYKSTEEKVKLAIMGAMADDGKITIEELKAELGAQGGSATGDVFPVEVQMDGHNFTVDENGTITNNGTGGSQPSEQGTLGTVTGQETSNTTVQDKLGNQVVVPAGFKVQNPDKTVPDGIIIEDISHEATKGSEFVWIPVGLVNIADGDPITIKLSRYTFDDAGKETDQGDKVIETYYQELATSDKGNTTAKNINAFKTSAVKNKGYYIGRYEARTERQRTAAGDNLEQLTERPGDYVYNYVTQPQAAERSRNMYVDNNFTSDLVNSYAWDTAITFLQAFDNRVDKTKPYSIQTRLYKAFENRGTNQLEKKDLICNIYDMAGNTNECTTETVIDNDGEGEVVVYRGGFADTYNYSINNRVIEEPTISSTSSTSSRNGFYMTNVGFDTSFRPLLYL